MDTEELETAVRRLSERVAALEAENAALREAPAGTMSRRQWLARGAAVAAGTVAGGVVAGVTPVAAASGPVTMNVTNNADSFTRLQADVGANETAVLQVWNLHTVLGVGVQGYGAQEGVQGNSPTGYGGRFDGALADLRLGGTRTSRPDAEFQPDSHFRGEVAFVNGLSNSGDLWLCVQSGTPGVWRRLTGFTSAGSLVVLSAPVRVYDSRAGQPPTAIGPKTPLQNGIDRVVATSGNVSGVDAEATAVLLNLTAIQPNAGGYLSVRSSAAAYSGTSNLNFAANTNAANMCLSRCSNTQVAIRLGGVASSCHVAVDVLGFYV